jgi:hypothetical protein
MKGNYIMLTKTNRLTMLSLFAAIFGFFTFAAGCDQPADDDDSSAGDDDSGGDDDDSAATDDDDSAE